MTPRSLRWGAAAAGLLASFYVIVLVWASGWAHLVAQAGEDWWLLTPITVGFGTQVALMVELRHRHRHRAQRLAPAASLAVGGQDGGRGTWDGDGPGGHHREGRLRFERPYAQGEPIELRIDGFDDPVVFRWASGSGVVR